jgi:hypothetical protein
VTNLEGTRRSIEPRSLACGAFCSADIVINDPFRSQFLEGRNGSPANACTSRFEMEKEGLFVFSEHPLRLYKGRMLPSACTPDETEA